MSRFLRRPIEPQMLIDEVKACLHQPKGSEDVHHPGHNVCVAKYAAIGFLADDGEKLSHFATHGLDDAARIQLGWPSPRASILRTLLEGRIPQRMKKLSGDPQSIGLPVSHPPVQSVRNSNYSINPG